MPTIADQTGRRTGELRSIRSGRPGENTGGRAVIGNVRGTAAGAPVVIVGTEGNVKGHVALVPVAQTAPATALSAAIVVRNDVIEAVRRIVTGANPCDGRLRGSRRTRGCRAAATAAEVAIDRAVAPVVAARRVLRRVLM